MVDRIGLLHNVANLPLELTTPLERNLEKSLNKSISVLLLGLDLEAARNSSDGVRREIIESLSACLSMAELKKVSKKWDPKRTVTSDTSHEELTRDLATLLNREREPFLPPKLTFNQANSLGNRDQRSLREAISHFCTPPQVKALVKKWDKFSELATSTNTTAQRSHLLSLLDGGKEISPRPAKKK